MFQQVRDLRTKFNEDFIDQHFGVGRNSVRERAWGRICELDCGVMLATCSLRNRKGKTSWWQ